MQKIYNFLKGTSSSAVSGHVWVEKGGAKIIVISLDLGAGKGTNLKG